MSNCYLVLKIILPKLKSISNTTPEITDETIR